MRGSLRDEGGERVSNNTKGKKWIAEYHQNLHAIHFPWYKDEEKKWAKIYKK